MSGQGYQIPPESLDQQVRALCISKFVKLMGKVAGWKEEGTYVTVIYSDALDSWAGGHNELVT